jgi:hypothetical protein
MDRRKATLEDLFRSKLAVTIGETTLWLRVLSDFDLQSRDEYDMHAMSTRRRALETPGTMEYETFVADISNHSDEDLRDSILVVAEMEFVREAQSADLQPDLQPNFYPFPDDATDEEKAEVLAKRDAEPARVEKLRLEWVKKRVEVKKLELSGVAHDQLVFQIKGSQKDAQGRAASMRAFANYTIYAATFKDEACKERAFGSPEQAGELAPAVKGFLYSKYFGELDTLQREDLAYFFSTADSKEPSSPPVDSAAVSPVAMPPETFPGP